MNKKLFLLSCLFVLMPFAAAAKAQRADNVSGLRGRRLTEQKNPLWLVGAALMPRKGKIAAVEVTRDAAQTLEVDVTFTDVDLSTPRSISGNIFDDRKQPIPATAAAVAVTARSGIAHLVFTLHGSLPEGTAIESKTLALRLNGEPLPPTGDAPGSTATDIVRVIGLLVDQGATASELTTATFTYALPKHWSVPARP